MTDEYFSFYLRIIGRKNDCINEDDNVSFQHHELSIGTNLGQFLELPNRYLCSIPACGNLAVHWVHFDSV